VTALRNVSGKFFSIPISSLTFGTLNSIGVEKEVLLLFLLLPEKQNCQGEKEPAV
jgi:hypothetical protein